MQPELMAFLVVCAIIVIVVATLMIVKKVKSARQRARQREYEELTAEILKYLGLRNWMYTNTDATVIVKSSRGVDNYQAIDFLKERRDQIKDIVSYLESKEKYADKLSDFLKENPYKERKAYNRVADDIHSNLRECRSYNIDVSYTSPAGRSTNQKMIRMKKSYIEELSSNPANLMTKSEYNQYLKQLNKEELQEQQHEFYEEVNRIIDKANQYRDKIIIKGDKDELDKQISSLFDRTINSIKKIKDINSEEWDMLADYINSASDKVEEIIDRSNKIYEYYDSPEFAEIKLTCKALIMSQKEFNDYISEKADAISELFGKRVIRNETVNEDKHNYIRIYKKSITPFTAEVSSSVFASAENNPMEYIVKYFYPDKSKYPIQIQKLQILVAELETLKEAKAIIDNYKKDYQQYIANVPAYVMENDEDGFYSRLGFANISESALTIEYRFSYTSDGGYAQRSFTVPMTEENIIKLIDMLESKLTMSAFTKEQRSLMTTKLRQSIKERDNYTCKYCGNSIYKEPNLLLEVDHITPISKGGLTTEDNLQTLCWKCNRKKGSKII